MIPKSDITSSPQEARVTTSTSTTLSNAVKNKRMFKALTINFDDDDDDDVKSVVNGSRKHKSTNADDDVKSVVNGSCRKHKSTTRSSIFSSSKRIFGVGGGGGRRGQGKNNKTTVSKNNKTQKKGGIKSGDGGGSKISKKQQQEEQQQRRNVSKKQQEEEQRRRNKKILTHLGAQVACPLSGAFLHNDGDDLFEKLDNLMTAPAVIKKKDDDDDDDINNNNKDVCGGDDIVVDCCDTDRISDGDDDDFVAEEEEEEESSSVFCSENSNLTASTSTTTNTTTSSSSSLEEEESSEIDTSSNRSDTDELLFLEGGGGGGGQEIQQHRDKKTIVGFVDTVQTWRIPSVSTYTKEEWEDCWYSDVERKALHSKREKVISRVEVGKPEFPYRPYRGLENWTTEGNDNFKYITKRMIDAVLDEQENQWRTNIDDHDQIAIISQTVSVLSVIKAIRNAQQDEIDANEIYLMPSNDIGGNDSFRSAVSIIDSCEDDEVETVCTVLSSVQQVDSKNKNKTTKKENFSDSSSLSARLLSKKKNKKRSSGDKTIPRAPSFTSLVARMNIIENDVDDMVKSNDVVDHQEV